MVTKLTKEYKKVLSADDITNTAVYLAKLSPSQIDQNRSTDDIHYLKDWYR